MIVSIDTRAAYYIHFLLHLMLLLCYGVCDELDRFMKGEKCLRPSE